MTEEALVVLKQATGAANTPTALTTTNKAAVNHGFKYPTTIYSSNY